MQKNETTRTSKENAKPILTGSPADFADTTFQALSELIASDYTYVVNARVLPSLGDIGELKLREVRVLATLAFYKSPISPTYISEVLRYDRATVTRAVRCLVRCGMVEQITNQQDSRSVLLKLTESGQQLAKNHQKAILSTFADLESQLLYGLDRDEKTAFLTTLLKISKRAQSMRTICQSSKA